MQQSDPEGTPTRAVVDAAILDLVAAPITLLRDDREIVYTNPEAAGLLGLAEDQAVGRDIRELLAAPTSIDLDSMPDRSRLRVETAPDRDGRQRALHVDVRRGGGLIGLIWSSAQPTDLADGHFQWAFRRAAPPMALLGRDRRLLDVNDALCAALDYGRDELMRMNLSDFGVPDPFGLTGLDGEQPEGTDGPSIQVDRRLRRRDGDWLHARVSTSAIRGSDGELTLHVISLSDVTPSRHGEAILREDEARLQLIMDAVDDVFWITDPVTRRLIYVSPGYEALVQRRVEDLLADPRSFLDSIAPDDRERVREQLVPGAYRPGEGVEYRILLPDGSMRWIRSKVFPVLDSSGALACYVGSATDITESRHIQQLQGEAERLEAMSELTGELAHDFNNLLAIINVNAGLLLEEHLDPSAASLVNKILAAAKLGTAITKSILSVGKQQLLEPVVCDLNRIVRENYDLIATAVGDSVRVDIVESAADVSVRIDPDKFSNALLNLAINAGDAMPDGGDLSIKVSRTSLAEGDKTVVALGLTAGTYGLVEVADTGVGMTPEVAGRAFEPFFTTKAPGLGAGLGLPAVYGFARRSGGRAVIESAPGQGTTVRIFLPLASDEPS